MLKQKRLRRATFGLAAFIALAVVSTALAFPKVAVPGPLTSLQIVVTVPGGFGRPSSVTVPLRFALEGSVIV